MHENVDQGEMSAVQMLPMREARLRREYVYRKSLEEKQRALEEDRKKVTDAVEGSKRIANHLKKDALSLQKGAEWGGQVNEVDDEYRWAGTKDPKVVLTTSRDPSSKLKMFSKEMKLMFPGAQRMNRGHYDVRHLVQACRANDVTDLLILTETRGRPDGLIVCHLPFGPTAYFNLSNVVMRHDVPERETVSEQYPHLVFHNMKSKLGLRFTSILKYLFPVPKASSKRIMSFTNANDFISFRHHTVVVDGADTTLKEIGPRFELRPYCIKLGTLESISAAETEWQLRSFMRTSKKRQFLAAPQDIESDGEEEMEE